MEGTQPNADTNEVAQFADAATPEELAQEMGKQNLAGYGFNSTEDVEIHNDVKLTVDLSGVGHRGRASNPGQKRLRDVAEKNGWRLAHIGFEDKTLMFEIDGWAAIKHELKMGAN